MGAVGRSSWASSPATRKVMQGNRAKDTAPELALRHELFRRGLRYRVHRRPFPSLRRTADVIFVRRKIAIFVDGCFWHGCPDHWKLPKSNAPYWESKVVANRSRDLETDQELKREGWTVVRVWEHEDVTTVVARIVRLLDEPN